jgi:hypothetical protein
MEFRTKFVDELHEAAARFHHRGQNGMHLVEHRLLFFSVGAADPTRPKRGSAASWR